MKANDQPVQAWKVKCYILSCRNIHRTVRKQNVHKLHNMCHVKEKEQWIKTGITPSNQSCSYPQDDMTKYANLIFDDPDKKSVLNHNCYILMLDLATIAQRGWISHAILNRVTDTLQINTEHTFVFILNVWWVEMMTYRRTFQENCQDQPNELFLQWILKGQHPTKHISACQVAGVLGLVWVPWAIRYGQILLP